MNSVPNSDSEQCTKSKLSRMHNAPTLGPACAHIGSALHHVAGLARPCRRLGPTVSQRTPGHVAAHAQPCLALFHEQCSRTPSRSAARRVAASLAVSRAQSSVSWPCSRPCRGLSRSYRGCPSMHRSAISWPGSPAVSQYNALYRDSSGKMGSSPFQLLHCFFFFFTHIFFSFRLLENHHIYIPVLHTVKLRKISSTFFFFISNSLLATPQMQWLEHCNSHTQKK